VPAIPISASGQCSGALDDRSVPLLDGSADGVRADDVFAIQESRRKFDVVEVAANRAATRSAIEDVSSLVGQQ
jgi:hypothetical protein